MLPQKKGSTCRMGHLRHGASVTFNVSGEQADITLRLQRKRMQKDSFLIFMNIRVGLESLSGTGSYGIKIGSDTQEAISCRNTFPGPQLPLSISGPHRLACS